MSMQRRSNNELQVDGWLAATLLDDALRVFATLDAIADGNQGALGELLRVAALGMLDDVARLAPLVGAAPTWPRLPRDPAADETTDEDDSPVVRAVGSLAEYCTRAAAVAALCAGCNDQSAAVFATVAVAAQDRIERLAA